MTLSPAVRARLVPALVIAGAALACYANSFRNPFVWDQEVVIQGNPLIRSWKNLPHLFTTNVEGRPLTSVGFYRPLESLSYMADYALWGLNPVGFHLTSLVLHVLNAVLLWTLLVRLGWGPLSAQLCGLAFAVHAVNNESVVYSIRGDLLCALFCLNAFHLFLSVRAGSRRTAFPAAACLALAFLSKENAVVLPPILLVQRLVSPPPPRESGKDAALRMWLLWGAMAAMTVFYVVLRLEAISRSTSTALSAIAAAPLGERILTLPQTLLTYVTLLAAPHHLHMEYHFLVRSAGDPFFWVPAASLAGLSWIFLSGLRRLPPGETALRGRLLLSSVWFFAGLAPFYNLAVPLHATLTEHWAYIPGMGFLAGLFAAGSRWREALSPVGRRVLSVALALWLGYNGVYTTVRNRDWRDALGLYQHDLALEPRSFVLHNNVGVIQFRRGDLEAAGRAFRNAIDASPGGRYDVARNNLGVILENEGKSAEAEREYRTSINLSRYELAYGNLGRLYLQQKRVREALEVSLEGARIYPFNAEIHYNLGLSHWASGRPDLAAQSLARVEHFEPGYKNVRELLGKLAGPPDRK